MTYDPGLLVEQGKNDKEKPEGTRLQMLKEEKVGNSKTADELWGPQSSILLLRYAFHLRDILTFKINLKVYNDLIMKSIF